MLNIDQVNTTSCESNTSLAIKLYPYGVISLDVIDYPRRGFSLDAHKRANNWPPNKKKKKTKKE